MSITPTLGRIVWYTPDTAEGIAPDGDGRCAAIVVRVWGDGTVNLAVFDSTGRHHPRSNVQLVQPGEERPAGHFCEWMPFQIGTAQRAEAAEKALAEQSSALQ